MNEILNMQVVVSERFEEKLGYAPPTLTILEPISINGTKGQVGPESKGHTIS